jgi:hypothetical protein
MSNVEGIVGVLTALTFTIATPTSDRAALLDGARVLVRYGHGAGVRHADDRER